MYALFDFPSSQHLVLIFPTLASAILSIIYHLLKYISLFGGDVQRMDFLQLAMIFPLINPMLNFLKIVLYVVRNLEFIFISHWFFLICHDILVLSEKRKHTGCRFLMEIFEFSVTHAVGGRLFIQAGYVIYYLVKAPLSKAQEQRLIFLQSKNTIQNNLAKGRAEVC